MNYAKLNYNIISLLALHWAVMSGNLQAVKCLLHHAANINSQDKAGNTPLHYATRHEYLEIAKVLLKYNADLKKTTLTGNTPLHNACEKGNMTITQLLLKNVSTNYFQVFHTHNRKLRSTL
jgi:ankyrin repeat protein